VTNSQKTPGLGVMGKQRSAVAARLRLSSGEITSLLRGNLKEATAPGFFAAYESVMHKSNYT
jgi:hypothetical protein